jgi:hypothetical protein
VGVGFYLATAIAGMTIVGHLLEGEFDKEPVLTLVFLAAGLLLGFYGAYMQLREVMRRSARARRNRHGG